MNKLRLGFLASHNGTDMQAIIDACKSGKLDAIPAVVICNNKDAMALKRAEKEGIPFYYLSGKNYPDPENLDSEILNALQKHNVDLVILAGYMRMLGGKTLGFYKNKILNIHPALLPKFGGKGMYGQFVHKAIINAKEKKTGVTIHLVDDKYDHGAIVAQREVAVLENDTPESLSKRVLAEEHKFFPEVLQKICKGEINLEKLI